MDLITSHFVTTFHDTYLTNPSCSPSSVRDNTDETELWKWIIKNHCNNCLLWAEEDLARRVKGSDMDIAMNKRAIYSYNQARNDAIECIDEQLLIFLGLVDAVSAQTDSPNVKGAKDARLNSETACSMMNLLAWTSC